MPIKSDEARNQNNRRRRLNNQINASRKQLNEAISAEDISRLTAKIRSLEEDKQTTYYDRKEKKYHTNAGKIDQEIEYAKDTNREMRQAKRKGKPPEIDTSVFSAKRDYTDDEKVNERKNAMFQREINLASRGSFISELSKSDVKIFYTMTSDLWNGKSDRNQAIIEALGVNTLEEAYDLIMGTEEAKKARSMANEDNIDDFITSPDYIKWLRKNTPRL